MSRTKCGLNGPVAVTPGTTPYHQSPANSMTTPLTARIRPISAETIRTTNALLRLFQQQDVRAGAVVTWAVGICYVLLLFSSARAAKLKFRTTDYTDGAAATLCRGDLPHSRGRL